MVRMPPLFGMPMPSEIDTGVCKYICPVFIARELSALIDPEPEWTGVDRTLNPASDGVESPASILPALRQATLQAAENVDTCSHEQV
jgi:hypothetical protein